MNVFQETGQPYKKSNWTHKTFLPQGSLFKAWCTSPHVLDHVYSVLHCIAVATESSSMFSMLYRSCLAIGKYREQRHTLLVEAHIKLLAHSCGGLLPSICNHEQWNMTRSVTPLLEALAINFLHIIYFQDTANQTLQWSNISTI